jgi:hypothetical protein
MLSQDLGDGINHRAALGGVDFACGKGTLSTKGRRGESMSLVNWVIGGLIVIVVLAMLFGIFGVFFYDKAASTFKSIGSTLEQLKGGLKRP